MQCLILDPEAGFMYQDPETNMLTPCEGVMQVVVSVARDTDHINAIPFLPYRDQEVADASKTKNYQMTCKKCLVQKRKDLCPHSLEERSF